MKIAAILFLLCTFGAIHAKEYPYELSVVAFFKDEMDILPEWIEYHRLLGFEHFWLYNNGSTDGCVEFLKPYIQKGIVELISWPSPSGVNWSYFQGLAYKDAVLRSKNKTKWLAIIDTDEFIVPIHGKHQLLDALNSMEKLGDCGGVCLYWLMFGTSHVYEIPQGQLLIENLLYRSEINFINNHHVKTICRPEKVTMAGLHVCSYKWPYRDYCLDHQFPSSIEDPNGAKIVEPLRIHHYWTRSVKHMLEVKSPRRAFVEGAPFSQEMIDYYQKVLNEVYDDTILQYVPEVKKRLGL